MIVTVGVVVNTLFARFLPRLEGIIFIVFTLAFISFLIVLWVLPPRLTAGEWWAQNLLTLGTSYSNECAAEVFRSVQGGGGWSSLGLNLLTAQSAIMFLIVGELYPVDLSYCIMRVSW